MNYGHKDKPLCPQPSESTLRFLVEGEARSLGESLLILKDAIDHWQGESESALKAGIGGLVAAGIGVVAGAGIGSAVCLIPGLLSLLAIWHSQAEIAAREKEKAMIRAYPELLQAIGQALSAGVPDVALLHGYDSICGAYDPETGLCAGDSPLHALQGRLEGMASGYRVVKQAINTHAPHLADWEHFTSRPVPNVTPADARKAIGPNTRLNALPVAAVPADDRTEIEVLERLLKDEPSPAGRDSVQNPPDTSRWVDDLLSYPSILIWGPPGSGKSTLAEWLIYKRVEMGHQVRILDPHRAYGQWEGLKVFGGGLDYEAIDIQLQRFAKLVKDRYVERESNPSFNPQPETVLAEEFTRWSSNCEHSGEFFEITVSDIRKIECYAVYVSHDRTLKALGGSSGMAKNRDNALLEIELIAQVDPTTKKASPSGKGKLKYPGQKAIEVDIPNLSNPSLATEKPTAPTADSQSNSLIDSLPPHMAAIVRFAQKKGQIKAADVQQNVRQCDSYSASQIREFFKVLEAIGIGKTEGEGDRVVFGV